VSRRVYQPASFLITKDITVGAERLLRIEAVVVHARSEMDREAGHGLLQAGLVLLHRPNRANRTGDQGTPRILQLRFSLRLAIDGRIFSHLAERGWSQLPAGVAVDAGRVHEEIAYYVRRQLSPQISHVYGSLSSSSIHLPDQDLCSLRLVSNQTTRTGRGQPDRITGRQRPCAFKLCVSLRDVQMGNLGIRHADRLPGLQSSTPEHSSALANRDRRVVTATRRDRHQPTA